MAYTVVALRTVIDRDRDRHYSFRPSFVLPSGPVTKGKTHLTNLLYHEGPQIPERTTDEVYHLCEKQSYEEIFQNFMSQYLVLLSLSDSEALVNS